MKTSLKFLSVMVITAITLSCKHMTNDDIVGNYKGTMKGSMQWTKLNLGVQDQSMDSDSATEYSIKKDEKGEFYFQNSRGAKIVLQNVTCGNDGITFTIPQQKMHGGGADSLYKCNLAGLSEFTLNGAKCDGYYNKKDNTIYLSFAGTLSVTADTIVYNVPFITYDTAFHKLKEESK